MAEKLCIIKLNQLFGKDLDEISKPLLKHPWLSHPLLIRAWSKASWNSPFIVSTHFWIISKNHSVCLSCHNYLVCLFIQQMLWRTCNILGRVLGTGNTNLNKEGWQTQLSKKELKVGSGDLGTNPGSTAYRMQGTGK